MCCYCVINAIVKKLNRKHLKLRTTGKTIMSQKPNSEYECPFTWDMDDIVHSGNFRMETSHLDEAKEFPMLQVFEELAKIYINVTKNKLESIEAEIQALLNSKKLLSETDLEQHKISRNVVDHIIYSSLYYIHTKINNHEQADGFQSKIPAEIKLDIEKSTLDGCKCIVWSLFAYKGFKPAIFFANRATKNNPQCAFWHYMLGKCLRNDRRRPFYNSNRPSFIERGAFLKAYYLSKHCMFAMRLAQCYKENGEKEKARQMYFELMATSPENYSVRCRLALGFLAVRESELAKENLDYVENRYPDDSMFLHYKGLYFIRLNRFKEAAECLEKAGLDNHRAQINYATCLERLGQREKLFLQNQPKKWTF